MHSKKRKNNSSKRFSINKNIKRNSNKKKRGGNRARKRKTKHKGGHRGRKRKTKHRGGSTTGFLDGLESSKILKSNIDADMVRADQKAMSGKELDMQRGMARKALFGQIGQIMEGRERKLPTQEELDQQHAQAQRQLKKAKSPQEKEQYDGFGTGWNAAEAADVEEEAAEVQVQVDASPPKETSPEEPSPEETFDGFGTGWNAAEAADVEEEAAGLTQFLSDGYTAPAAESTLRPNYDKYVQELGEIKKNTIAQINKILEPYRNGNKLYPRPLNDNIQLRFINETCWTDEIWTKYFRNKKQMEKSTLDIVYINAKTTSEILGLSARFASSPQRLFQTNIFYDIYAKFGWFGCQLNPMHFGSENEKDTILIDKFPSFFRGKWKLRRQRPDEMNDHRVVHQWQQQLDLKERNFMHDGNQHSEYPGLKILFNEHNVAHTTPSAVGFVMLDPDFPWIFHKDLSGWSVTKLFDPLVDHTAKQVIQNKKRESGWGCFLRGVNDNSDFALKHDPYLHRVGSARPEGRTPLQKIDMEAGGGVTFPICGNLSPSPPLSVWEEGKIQEEMERAHISGLSRSTWSKQIIKYFYAANPFWFLDTSPDTYTDTELKRKSMVEYNHIHTKLVNEEWQDLFIHPLLTVKTKDGNFNYPVFLKDDLQNMIDGKMSGRSSSAADEARNLQSFRSKAAPRRDNIKLADVLEYAMHTPPNQDDPCQANFSKNFGGITWNQYILQYAINMIPRWHPALLSGYLVL